MMQQHVTFTGSAPPDLPWFCPETAGHGHAGPQEGEQAEARRRDTELSETRLNRAIAGAVVVLILLVLAAVINPLLASPAPIAAATTAQQVVSNDPPTDAALVHQAVATEVVTAVHVQAAQAHAAAMAAQAAALAKAQAAAAAAARSAPPAPDYSGVLSCGQVESLWISAGGPPSLAVLMAEIAGAESSRNPAAPYGGLWQIQGGQPVPGNINDPVINAENAVSKYRSQGLTAWTTYTSGAYQSHPC